MLTVEEAIHAVLAEARPLAPQNCLLDDAQGLVLAEDVRAEADSPPFDKAVVDGYAIRTADVQGSSQELSIGELITAGRTPARPLGRGEAAVIMTGAPIPPGCDAVVMHERTRTSDRGVLIEPAPVRPGQNVLPRGAEMCAGDVVLAHGIILHPAQLECSHPSARSTCGPCRGHGSQSCPPVMSWSSPRNLPDRARFETRTPSCCCAGRGMRRGAPARFRLRVTSRKSWRASFARPSRPMS